MSDRFIKSAVWNIDGLSLDKMTDADFTFSVKNVHILSLVETWSNDQQQCTNIPGFCLIDQNIRKKT